MCESFRCEGIALILLLIALIALTGQGNRALPPAILLPEQKAGKISKAPRSLNEQLQVDVARS